MKLQGDSKGLISTWTFVKDYNLLVDAGEGVTNALYHTLGSINHIVLTHPHFDHVGGLAGLLHLQSRVAPHVRPKLYLPGESPRFHKLLDLLGPRARENLRIYRTDIEKEFDLGGGRVMTTFPIQHSPISRGLMISETRSKLRDEFVGLPGSEIKRLKLSGADIEKRFRHKLLAITGDTGPLRQEDIYQLEGTDILLTEATFLKRHDRMKEKVYEHNDLETFMESHKFINPRRTILHHISPRHPKELILEAKKSLAGTGVDLVFGGFQMEIILGKEKGKAVEVNPVESKEIQATPETPETNDLSGYA